MSTYKLTIAYDGTDFVGWQRQDNGTSVQGLLEAALEALAGSPVNAVAAGRTDAGVHALGQVVGVTLARAYDARTVGRAVNARLPPSIRVLEADIAPSTFHARFDARRKTYRYRIWNGDVLSPFERAYAWHLPGPPLDVHQMEAAARVLEGHHDFSAFQAAGADLATSDRTMFSSRIVIGTAFDVSRPSPLITYEVSGDGFLRHMVRAIVGTLVEVGRGRRPAAWVTDVLASRERGQAGPTAPPEGLFLVGVTYE